jgi:hypothetical protein
MEADRHGKRAEAARGRVPGGLCAAALALAAPGAGAEPLTTPSYTLYGTPGLVDMPSAEMAPDAELAFTGAGLGDTLRTTLTFQLAPRISGSLRYAVLDGYDDGGADRYDRSFDLRVQLLGEGAWWPAIAVGLQDFVGTGIYSGEYVVATKSFGRQGALRATAGIGWGRFGTDNVIAGEEGTRVTEFLDTGGTVNFDQLFTGPVGAFGGLAWQATDRLAFKAEYSSDAYVSEAARGLIEVDSPWNFGIDYEIAEGARLGASWLYGTELGVQLTFAVNPKTPPAGPGFDTAPPPVQGRPAREADPLGWSGAWIETPGQAATLRAALAEGLAEQGLILQSAALSATRAEVRLQNTRWDAEAQALGRAVRVMSRVLPPSVETFTVIPVRDGVASAAYTFRRSDIERLETAPGAAIVAAAEVSGGAGRPPADAVTVAPYPRLTWDLGPYAEWSLFDPDEPVRANFGLRLRGAVDLSRGLVASAELRQPIVGNLDEITREADGTLPPVRSDFPLYVQDNDLQMDRLTLAHYGRPSDDLYSRVTAGYLERMYAGVSGELLWKPVDSRLALGAELNYVQKRDFDDTFGFLDYDVVTGHASLYYEAGNGYFGQVDVGRYLAGDAGATFTLERVFANGWRVGAFATFTDVPFDEFGEGSFDKGIRVTVPVSWLTGRPSRASYTTVLRPLTKDGGQRVQVGGRLYERVRDSHLPWVETREGRFWK